MKENLANDISQQLLIAKTDAYKTDFLVWQYLADITVMVNLAN